MTSNNDKRTHEHKADGKIPPMTTDEQCDVILNILVDFLPDDIAEYIRHVGFDIQDLGGPKNLVDGWLGHYRLRQGPPDAPVPGAKTGAVWPLTVNGHKRVRSSLYRQPNVRTGLIVKTLSIRKRAG